MKRLPDLTIRCAYATLERAEAIRSRVVVDGGQCVLVEDLAKADALFLARLREWESAGVRRGKG